MPRVVHLHQGFRRRQGQRQTRQGHIRGLRPHLHYPLDVARVLCHHRRYHRGLSRVRRVRKEAELFLRDCPIDRHRMPVFPPRLVLPVVLQHLRDFLQGRQRARPPGTIGTRQRRMEMVIQDLLYQRGSSLRPFRLRIQWIRSVNLGISMGLQ